jgi:hypothetical protein
MFSLSFDSLKYYWTHSLLVYCVLYYSKGLVAAVADEDPLTLLVARGSGVLERHETAVVDLCQQSGTDDKEVENCVVDYLTGGYEDIEDDINNDESCNEEDPDAECLLDNMMNMWADELPPETSGILDDEPEPEKEKVKPWSSRVSGSGTYVRDPATGEMRNIDA